MTDTEFYTLLQNLTLRQLNSFHAELMLKIQQHRTHQTTAIKKLSQRDNINKLADNLGLDLTVLMREVARH